MKNGKTSPAKRVALFAAQVIAAAAVFFLIEILFIDGMFLTGVPSADEVESVTVEYPTISDRLAEATDSENIELAVDLTGFLRYSAFKSPDESAPALITITYRLIDGREQTVAANNETVWWNGKAHSLKQPEVFVNLTKGIFFG